MAQRVANQLHIAVDDLFSVVESAGRDNLLGSDGVRFKPEGYTILGKIVADFIRKYV